MSTKSTSDLDHAQFATLLSFLDNFGQYIGVEDITYTDLQSFLSGSQEDADRYVKLHIKLLLGVGNTSTKTNTSNWEKHLAKYCEDFKDGDDKVISEGGYKSLTPAARLRILNVGLYNHSSEKGLPPQGLKEQFNQGLHYLLDSRRNKNLLDEQFEYNSRFNEKVNKPSDLNCLRQEPLGKDKFGRLYWYFVDDELGLRVYREWRDVINEEYNWELVCQDEDGLQEVIESLEKEEPPKETFKGMKWKEQQLTHLKLHGMKEVTVDVDRLDEELTDRLKSHSMKLEDIESYLNKTIARRKTTGEEGPENAKQDEVSDKEMEITESNNKDEEESEKENQEKDKIDEVSESTSNNRESNSSEKEIPESCEVFDKTESERESSIEANRDERESKEKEKNNEVSDSASNSEKEIHESSEVIEKSESERGRESSMEANRDEKESQENDKIDDELSESTSNNRETYSSEKEIHDGSEFVKENSTERESSLEANKKENEGEGVEEEKMEVDDLDSVAASDESSTSSPKGSEKVGHDDSEEMSAKNSKSGSENQSDKESEDEIVNEGDEMDEKTATVDDKTLEDKSEGEKEESGTNSAKEMDIDKDVSSVEMVDKSLSEKQSEIENNDSDSSSNSAANEEDIDQNQIDSKKSSEIENDSDNSSNESDRKCSDSENTKDSLKKEPSVESQASKKNASSDSSVSEADDESEQIKSEENEVFHPKHKKLKKRSSLNKIRSQSNSDSDSDSDDSEKKDSEYSVKNASARSRSSPDDSENEVPSNNSDISVQAVDDNNDRDVKSDNSTAENESRSSPKLESITKISGSNKDSDEREISSSGNDSDSDKKSDTESGSKNIEDTDSKSNLDGNTENVENCFESKDLSYVENTKLKESTLQGQSRDSDSQHSRTQPDKIYVNGYSDKTIDAQHAMSFEGFKLKSKKPSDVTVDQIKDAVDKKPSKDILKHEASIHSDKVIVQKLLSSDRTVESVVTEKGAACEVKPDLVKKEPCKVNEIKTETEMKPLFEKFILSGALNKQNLRKNLQNIKNDIQQLQNSLNTGKKQNNVHGVSSSKLKPDNSVVDVKEHSEKVNDKKETKADNNESESSSDSTDSSPSDESTDSSSSDSDHKSDSAAVQNKDSDREFNIIDQGEKVKSEIDLIISDAIGELNENQSPTNENISIESSENSNDSVIITKISSGSSSVQSIASPDPDDDDDDDDNDDGGESDSDGETKTEDYKSARSRTDTKRTSKSSSQEMSNDSFKANNELEEWHVEVNEDYNSDDNSKPSSKEGTPVDEDSNQIKDSKSSSIDQNKLSGKDPKSKGTHHLLDYMKSKRNKKSKSDNLKTASDEGSPANVLPILDTLKNQFKVQDHSSPQTRVKYRQGSSPQKARPGRPRKGNVMYRVETAVNTSQKTPITNESQLPESSKSLAKSALSKILSQPVNVDLDTVGINAKQPTNINVKQPNVVFMNSGQFANFTSGQKPNLQVIAGGHTSTRPAMYYPRYVFMPGTNNIVPIEQFARNIPINNKRMPRLNSLLNAGRPFIRPRVVNITHPPRMPGPRPGLLPDCYMTKFNVKNMNQTQSQYLKNIMNQPLTEAEKRIRGPQKKRKRGKQKVIEIDSSGNDSDASFEKLLEDAQEEDGESELEPEDPSYDYDTLSSRIRKARNQGKKDTRFSLKGLKKDQPITFSSDEVDSDVGEEVPYVVGRNALRLTTRRNYAEMDPQIIESDSDSSEQEKPVEIVEELSDEPCQVCGRKDNLELLLMCDVCDDCYHATCLSPPMMVVPPDSWYCPPCEHEKLLTAMRTKLEEFLKEVKKFQRKQHKEQQKQMWRERIALRSSHDQEPELDIDGKPLPMGTNFGLSLDNILTLGRSRSTRSRPPVKYTTEEYDSKLNEALKENKTKADGKKAGRGTRSRPYKDDTDKEEETSNSEGSTADDESEESEENTRRKGHRSRKQAKSSSATDSESEKCRPKGRRSTRGKQAKSETESDREAGKNLRKGRRSTRGRKAKTDSETEDEDDKKQQKGRRSTRGKKAKSVSETDDDDEKNQQKGRRSTRGKAKSDIDSDGDFVKSPRKGRRSTRGKKAKKDSESDSEVEKRKQKGPRSRRGRKAKSESDSVDSDLEFIRKEKNKRKGRSARAGRNTLSVQESDSVSDTEGSDSDVKIKKNKRQSARKSLQTKKVVNMESASETEDESVDNTKVRSTKKKGSVANANKKSKRVKSLQKDSENDSASETEEIEADGTKVIRNKKNDNNTIKGGKRKSSSDRDDEDEESNTQKGEGIKEDEQTHSSEGTEEEMDFKIGLGIIKKKDKVDKKDDKEDINTNSGEDSEEEMDYKTRIELMKKKGKLSSKGSDSEAENTKTVRTKKVETKSESRSKKNEVNSRKNVKSETKIRGVRQNQNDDSESDFETSTKNTKAKKDRRRSSLAKNKDSDSGSEQDKAEVKALEKRNQKGRGVRNGEVSESDSATEEDEPRSDVDKSRRAKKRPHKSKSKKGKGRKSKAKQPRLTLSGDEEAIAMETGDSDYNCSDSSDSEDKEWDKMYLKKDRSLGKEDDVDKGPYVTRSGRSTNSSSRIKKYM